MYVIYITNTLDDLFTHYYYYLIERVFTPVVTDCFHWVLNDGKFPQSLNTSLCIVVKFSHDVV